MAFSPSNNILDKDTHNMLVKSFVNGGIGYTEDDGTVHKISSDYVEGGGGGGGAFYVTFGGTESKPTSDKTFAETKAAYDEGKVILGIDGINNYGIAPMYYKNANGLEAFSCGITDLSLISNAYYLGSAHFMLASQGIMAQFAEKELTDGGGAV